MTEQHTKANSDHASEEVCDQNISTMHGILRVRHRLGNDKDAHHLLVRGWLASNSCFRQLQALKELDFCLRLTAECVPIAYDLESKNGIICISDLQNLAKSAYDSVKHRF